MILNVKWNCAYLERTCLLDERLTQGNVEPFYIEDLHKEVFWELCVPVADSPETEMGFH